MTIALGILAEPSMVLAADTELSTVEARASAPKLRWVKNLPLAGNDADAFAITGSGPTGYLEAIFQELQDAFLNNRSFGMDELETLFKAHLEEFYSDHVIPFLAPDRPDVSLILCAERNNRRRMWVTDRNILRRVTSGFAAVGMGEMKARTLLENLDFPLDGQTAQVLAAYIIFRVKRLVQGCGLETDVLCIHDHDVSGLHRAQVRQLEEVFRRYEVTEGAMLHHVIGNDFEPDAPRRLANGFAALRKEVSKIINPRKLTKHLPKQGNDI